MVSRENRKKNDPPSKVSESLVHTVRVCSYRRSRAYGPPNIRRGDAYARIVSVAVYRTSPFNRATQRETAPKEGCGREQWRRSRCFLPFRIVRQRTIRTTRIRSRSKIVSSTSYDRKSFEETVSSSQSLTDSAIANLSLRADQAYLETDISVQLFSCPAAVYFTCRCIATDAPAYHHARRTYFTFFFFFSRAANRPSMSFNGKKGMSSFRPTPSDLLSLSASLIFPPFSTLLAGDRSGNERNVERRFSDKLYSSRGNASRHGTRVERQ